MMRVRVRLPGAMRIGDPARHRLPAEASIRETTAGLGLRLIERALASEMGGKAGIDYRPAGCGSRSRRRCPSGSRWCRTSSSPS